MSIAVELREVSRHFGNVRAVDSVSLAIEDGEFFSMLGPSGSGKTTCLRLIGGFELPTSGQIFLHGEDASDLPPYRRDVNTVFQDYALFPHLSVLDNVAYGLRMKGIGRVARRREAGAALEQVALAGLGDRHPGQLSGGQRQRVALARALVNRPRVLLLDEPLGALDLKLREQMQVELKGLQRRLGITFIYVTHDQGEALSMSDRVAVFHGGRVEQIDRPRELYVRPRTTFVAGFVGTANVLTGELARRITGSDRPVSIRPERVRFGVPAAGQLGIAGSVIDVQFHGPTSRFEIEAAGVRLAVTIANRETEGALPEPGDAVQLAWSPDAMVELRASEADDRAARVRAEGLSAAINVSAERRAPDTMPGATASPFNVLPAAPPFPGSTDASTPIESVTQPGGADPTLTEAIRPEEGRAPIETVPDLPLAPIETAEPSPGPPAIEAVTPEGSAGSAPVESVSPEGGHQRSEVDAREGNAGSMPVEPVSTDAGHQRSAVDAREGNAGSMPGALVSPEGGHQESAVDAREGNAGSMPGALVSPEGGHQRSEVDAREGNAGSMPGALVSPEGGHQESEVDAREGNAGSTPAETGAVDTRHVPLEALTSDEGSDPVSPDAAPANAGSSAEPAPSGSERSQAPRSSGISS